MSDGRSRYGVLPDLLDGVAAHLFDGVAAHLC